MSRNGWASRGENENDDDDDDDDADDDDGDGGGEDKEAQVDDDPDGEDGDDCNHEDAAWFGGDWLLLVLRLLKVKKRCSYCDHGQEKNEK